MLSTDESVLPQADPPLYSRALAYSSPMEHSALTSMADSQGQMLHNKRNGRYDDDYPTYQEQKKPMIGYPTKSLTQRRPLSARSYSTETYGASQVGVRLSPQRLASTCFNFTVNPLLKCESRRNWSWDENICVHAFVDTFLS